MMRTSRLPSQTDIWSGKVIDGQVRPGMLSTARNRRGKRPISESMSCLPRSTISSRVAVGGEDFRAGIGRGAEHAHGVIMRQQDIFDRLVGDLGDAIDHLLRHHRRRLGVDDHHAIIADDHPGIGIAFGGEGIEIGPDRVEGDGLVGEIGGRGKIRAHRLFTQFL